MGGTQIGKRYVDDADTIQLLCTKAGQGTLALDGKPAADSGGQAAAGLGLSEVPQCA